MDGLSFFASFLKMIAALAIVLGVLVGALYLLKKAVQSSPMAPGAQDAIRVLSIRQLGPKNTIVLVDVLGQVLILGVGQAQLSLLGTVSDDRSLEKIRGPKPSGHVSDTLLDRWLRRREAVSGGRKKG